MTRVLLVDDDQDLLFLIGEHLNMNGIECHYANSVSMARKRLVRWDYDVVVSDLQMPGESGLELFRFLRLRRPRQPFILMSGNLDPWTKRDASRMGVCRFLEKPFELSALKHLITAPAPSLARAGIGAPAA